VKHYFYCRIRTEGLFSVCCSLWSRDS